MGCEGSNRVMEESLADHLSQQATVLKGSHLHDERGSFYAQAFGGRGLVAARMAQRPIEHGKFETRDSGFEIDVFVEIGFRRRVPRGESDNGCGSQAEVAVC